MNESAVVKRRLRVAELYVQGWSQAAIAAEVEVCPATVSVDLSEVRKVWALSVRLHLDELRAEALAKLNAIDREAWTDYRLTRNPRYLEVLQKNVELRCKLLGLLKNTLPSETNDSIWDMIAQGPDDEVERRIAAVSQPQPGEE